MLKITNKYWVNACIYFLECGDFTEEHVSCTNAVWVSGDWHDGTWVGGIWLNGLWYGGYWYSGVWLNGDWRTGMTEYGMRMKISPKADCKPNNTLSLNYANYK